MKFRYRQVHSCLNKFYTHKDWYCRFQHYKWRKNQRFRYRCRLDQWFGRRRLWYHWWRLSCSCHMELHRQKPLNIFQMSKKGKFLCNQVYRTGCRELFEYSICLLWRSDRRCLVEQLLELFLLQFLLGQSQIGIMNIGYHRCC